MATNRATGHLHHAQIAPVLVNSLILAWLHNSPLGDQDPSLLHIVFRLREKETCQERDHRHRRGDDARSECDVRRLHSLHPSRKHRRKPARVQNGHARADHATAHVREAAAGATQMHLEDLWQILAEVAELGDGPTRPHTA